MTHQIALFNLEPTGAAQPQPAPPPPFQCRLCQDTGTLGQYAFCSCQAGQARKRERAIHTEARHLARLMLREWQEEYQPPVNALPPEERPTNRMIHYGAGALSTAEILAIILGGPQQLYQAGALLARFDGLIGLARAGHHELTQIEGIGPSTAARIKACYGII